MFTTNMIYDTINIVTLRKEVHMPWTIEDALRRKVVERQEANGLKYYVLKDTGEILGLEGEEAQVMRCLMTRDLF